VNYLLSFADSRLWRSLSRLNTQAEKLEFFDSILLLTENDLDLKFKSKYKEKLVLGSRGYGYWSWKPQIIRQAFDQMEFGDTLLYIDVGCHLNETGLWRLKEYFETIQDEKNNGILAFQAKVPTPDISPLNYDGRKLFDQPNFRWIKGDLFNYFNVRDDENYTHSQAIGATVILIYKNYKSMKIIEEWQSIIDSNFSLIDDTPSKSDNLDGFIEHRHDQAIFTLLCIKHKVQTLSAYEYWYPKNSQFGLIEPDWNVIKDFPIQAKRDLDFGRVKS